MWWQWGDLFGKFLYMNSCFGFLLRLDVLSVMLVLEFFEELASCLESSFTALANIYLWSRWVACKDGVVVPWYAAE
jgi:hypothetical protein